MSEKKNIFISLDKKLFFSRLWYRYKREFLWQGHSVQTVCGRWEEQVLMSKITWLSVGGPADCVFHPQDEEDLSHFLGRQKGSSFLVMGAGSNVLIRDGGIRSTVVRLGRGFRQWIDHSETDIELGAGLLDRAVAQECQKKGISGFEFLFTIPGTIGGGLAMNAGCYGGEYADRLLWAKVMDTDGKVHRLTVDDLGFGYRHCQLPKGWIFLSGCFRGTLSTPDQVQKTMDDFAAQRQNTQPVHVKTGGSTFANPKNGPKAWELIDQVGFRGRILGGAQFSEKHCNFLINLGNSTASDLENLGEQAREAVFTKTGISLEWEIVRWGEPLPL